MKAAFAAGCFWGVQKSFDKLKGVSSTTVGYMGGKTKNPTYQNVCTGTTGHAETVLVEYNPKIIVYKDLLETFFNIHDPTTINRQGFDIGTQYRSVIFYFNEPQKKQAQTFLKHKQEEYKNKIATKIVKAGTFYKAEDYHQKHYLKPFCFCGKSK